MAPLLGRSAGSIPVMSTNFLLRYIMARVTSQNAVEMIGNRYDLVLIASLRAKELKKNYAPKVMCENGPQVTAIREIEAGAIGREYLKKVKTKKEE
jgi:DNA-directed RNA polymerase subunit omega